MRGCAAGRRAYSFLVAVGSNVEPERWVGEALARLRARFDVVAVSPLYDVPALGGGVLPDFVNLAVRLRSDLPPPALRTSLRHIEEQCGRRRSADRHAPRTIDLDLVLAAPDVPCRAGLPHPDLLARPYVLVPAAVVWPEATATQDGRTLGALAAERWPDWGAHLRRRREDT
jgi:2-amino-4-hydroxy-6-hydroxymethyldihydropteridine diphosphokinase